MVDSYNTILTPGIDEIVEKKSRFIGYAQPVSSEEEAYAFVESVKKKHYDARHNCFLLQSIFSDVETPAVIPNDGKQTPMKGHPVFIAQHATATCCRECIRKWHKIQPGRELSQIQQEYLVDVIMTWIQREMERNKG